MHTGRVVELTRMLAASERARESHVESAIAESALPEGAAPSRPKDILDVIDANLSRAASLDRGPWIKARDFLLANASTALDKVSRGDRGLSIDEACAMEAVIIGDGTRPSFVLSNGRVNPEDPFLGTWGGTIAAADANGIADLAKAVGRIQPVGGHATNFIGTGTLIDRDAGLLLTNYHVVRLAGSQFGVKMTFDDYRIRIDSPLVVDFVAEADSLETNRHRIVEVLLPQGYGEVFSGNDVVVARLDLESDEAALPQSVAQLSARPAYANGAVTSIAVIGFPSEPKGVSGQNVDWNFVIRTLFANTFGVKRLAPGRFTAPLGSHLDDRVSKRAIGHDATTLGGVSGALLSAWLDTNTPCFAIHFGGATGQNNYALSFAVSSSVLKPLGVVI